MFDYNKILEVKGIELRWLDNDTLIDCYMLELGKDEEGLSNWICIEVWVNENNAIKIIEQNDFETVEITSKLTEEQKNHVYKLVEKSMNELE